MSEKKCEHTPGPWEAGRSDMMSYDVHFGHPYKNVYGSEADPRCKTHKPTGNKLPLTIAVSTGEDGLSNEEIIANSLLIAAAPEMYEEIKELRDLLMDEDVYLWFCDRGMSYLVEDRLMAIRDISYQITGKELGDE